MRGTRVNAMFVIVMLLATAGPLYCAQVFGKLTQVANNVIYANFPVPVRSGAMVTILAAQSDSVAGLAIIRRCQGDSPPYRVTGELRLITDSESIVAGTEAYVDAINTSPVPSKLATEVRVARPLGSQELRLYYYAAGHTVGYGALGLGYERGIRLYKGLRIQVDGGITGVGSVDSAKADVVNTNQLIKSLNGKLVFDLGSRVGIYSAYRWTEGRGDPKRWDQLSQTLVDKAFVAPSTLNEGTVQTRGIEYGLSLRMARWLNISGGYIPSLRVDYGSFGVRSQPAYAAELRLGESHIVARFRGTYSDGYWIGDMGVTLR